MKELYNRIEVGDRIRKKRQLLGFTQDTASAKIGISAKFLADIERGSCGMSVETMLSIASLFDMSLDYIIKGITYSEEEKEKHTNEYTAILSLLENVPENKRKYALRLLQLQIESWN